MSSNFVEICNQMDLSNPKNRIAIILLKSSGRIAFWQQKQLKDDLDLERDYTGVRLYRG